MVGNNIVSTTDGPVVIDTSIDYDYVEQNLRRIIEETKTQVTTLSNLADQSQQPRAYEVLHNFYKMMLEANRELLQTKKTKAEIDAINNPGRHLEQGDTTVNNLFVGSTAELQRFLKERTIDHE